MVGILGVQGLGAQHTQDPFHHSLDIDEPVQTRNTQSDRKRNKRILPGEPDRCERGHVIELAEKLVILYEQSDDPTATKIKKDQYIRFRFKIQSLKRHMLYFLICFNDF